MSLNFEFFESSGTAVASGVFIPQNNLMGINAGEFADSESLEKKESKLVYSLCNKFVDGSLNNALGISVSQNAITGQSSVLSSKSYTATIQYYASIKDQFVNVLPVPTIGNQVGIGEIIITDLFPNAVKVESGSVVSSEGVLIPSALLADYGAQTHVSLDLANDNRSWVGALIRYIVNTISLRSTLIASAITGKSVGAIATLTLPAIATDLTNPTTGFVLSDLLKIDIYSKTFSITIQRLENELNQSFDINVITA
ncbi:MAG: hypothetical protein GW856_02775 [Cyanobacteria bacterium]|nr:hypothetical protein [Cyanobacteria bacterium CG_2015-16_32_12]